MANNEPVFQKIDLNPQEKRPFRKCMIARKLREANLLDTQLRPTNLPLVIDLSELTCVASSDLAALVDIFPRLHAAGISVVLAGLREEVLRVFEITHLDRLFCLIPARGPVHPPASLRPDTRGVSNRQARRRGPISTPAFRPGDQRLVGGKQRLRTAGAADKNEEAGLAMLLDAA